MIEKPILFKAEMVRAILDGRKTVTRRVVDMSRLRARLPEAVTGDLEDVLPKSMHCRAEPGIYNATIHGAGAVTVDIGGVMLAVKPGEFNFVCPYADTVTHLRNHRWCLDVVGESRLWVKETFKLVPATAYRSSREEDGSEVAHRVSPDDNGYEWAIYRATWTRSPGGTQWKPSIFMPRWASRIALRVKSVRIERLHDITADDACAEGMPPPGDRPARINGKPGTVTFFDPLAAYTYLWDEINGAGSWALNPWVWRIEFERVGDAVRAA